MKPTPMLDAETYRKRFVAFYEELTHVYPEVFAKSGAKRIGSTFPIVGAGGLDAQTFYMKAVLALVFEDAVVVDLMMLARAVQRQGALPDAPRLRLEKVPHLRHILMTATEAAMTLTVQVGRWETGTDLFANVLVNTEAILQICGVADASFSAESLESDGDSGLMDQSAIDALFA